MPTAEITVSYINAAKPGKKMGSIKSAEGDYYYCQPTMLHLFQIGEVCKVEFTERPKEGGGTWKTLVTKLGGGALKPLGPAPMRAMTNPKDSKQIFMTALLKEMVVETDTSTSIIQKGKYCSDAYDVLFGSVAKQNTEAELNDSIPDF